MPRVGKRSNKELQAKKHDKIAFYRRRPAKMPILYAKLGDQIQMKLRTLNFLQGVRPQPTQWSSMGPKPLAGGHDHPVEP